MVSRLPFRDLPRRQAGVCECASVHARKTAPRVVPLWRRRVFGIQRCKAWDRPNFGGHGAGERVILEVDLGHCWKQGDRVGDGAVEAVLLEEAASKQEGSI